MVLDYLGIRSGFQGGRVLGSVQVSADRWWMVLYAKTATTEETRRHDSRRMGKMKFLRDASAAC